MKPASSSSHKSFLRAKLRRRLAAISPDRKRRKSRAVCSGIIRSDFFQEAKSLLIYMARRDELDTRLLIRRALKDRKAVFLPRLTPKGIAIYRVHHLKRHLEPGAYGIFESKARPAHQGKIRAMDLAVVPGLGFTEAGIRLGRGGGHFDRLLARAGSVIKIGVCFREQLLKKIPAAKHDVRMNFIFAG